MDAILSVSNSPVSIPDDLLDFAPRYLYIQDKKDNITTLTPNTAQRDFYQKVMDSESRFHLLIKARQIGFSTFIQAWQLYEAIRQPLRAATMAHDSDTTAKLRRMAKLYYDYLPDSLGVQRETDNAAVTSYLPHHSEVTIATAGGRAKGRGGTYNLFHGSEVAFWSNPEQTIAGALQGLTKDGLCIFETSANGAQGWTWETVNKPGKWYIHFYPWYWEPEYKLPVDDPIECTDDELQLIERAADEGFDITPEQIAWRRDKQAELGFLFDQEYPETLHGAFLTSGNGFFGYVDHVYAAPLNQHYDPAAQYIGGLDFGQADDYTVLIILNESTLKMVDMLRINRMEWRTMRQRIAELAHKWNATIIGEANSMGRTNIELLQSGEYSEAGQLLYEGINLIPFDTTAKSKPPLIRGLYHALHEAGLTLQPVPEINNEIRNFVSTQSSSGHWRYEGGNGAHDDCVIALALAWHGLHNPYTPTTIHIPDIWGR